MISKPDKIGILTFHNTTNYGATLQAYALQKRLAQLGMESEIIDYRPKKATQMYRRALRPNRFWFYNMSKVWFFAKFRKQHLSLSASSTDNINELPHIVKQYKNVIIGSDEIWNVNSFRGFDKGFFLPFEETKEVGKFSYAASVGAARSFGKHKSEITSALTSFEKISVRDAYTQSLLKNECNLSSETVVDPTLLIDFKEFLQDQPSIKKPYILLYGTITPEEEVDVLKIAEQLNCQIISVGEFNKCAHKNLLSSSIPQWLNLIDKAEYVCTSFYHGAIFAWKFDKPFIFLKRASKTAKFDGLVKDLKLIESQKLPIPNNETRSNLSEYTSSSETMLRLQTAKSFADQFLIGCRK